MELPKEKISFEKRNVGAFGNSSYNQEYHSPPECCGKQSDLNGYLQPINGNGNRISSNHDYLIVQGSVKSNVPPDKEPDEPHSWLHPMKKEKRGDHCGNEKEFSDLDKCPYSVIADSNIKQQDVKAFPLIKYVEGPLNSQEIETQKALKSSSCSRCKIVAIVMIIVILMTAVGLGVYFPILRNNSKEKNTSSSLPSISNKTMNTSTTDQYVTFGTTILSTDASTYTTTNSADLLTTPTHDQDISSESSSSQAPSTTIQPHCSPTGNLILRLNPDQIADLAIYRNWLLHTCEADIGYPAGDISIEIMKSGDLEFRKLDVTIERSEDNITSCEIHRKIEFGIVFTSDMEKAIIRCKVINTYFPDTTAFYSNNDTVSLIPGDACKDNTVYKSIRVHPTNCHYYIECQLKEPYGHACHQNLCFGIYSVDTCNYCNLVTCPKTNASCSTLTTNQKKTVKMTVHADQIVGLTSPRTSNLHTCTGYIGNRTGDIAVEIQLAGSDNYQTISPSYITETDTTENCEIIRVLKFWIGFTVAMYNATIRCKATNGLKPDDSPTYSNHDMLSLVSSDFCDQNFNGTNRYIHPTNCRRFVTCEEKVTYVHACPSDLCFSVKIDKCDWCFNVQSCT
ncbi:unnamed protein product [Mytilus edulis]|uniref:Chitin-binding type-2 domain-containing protein n=1 Tax=Mytilus edulis TaxID=6550 RepID=A0A8S3STB8_MYTED|nr:unnamed protein product [Mytilus edulis]